MKNAMLDGADLIGLEEAAGPSSYARGLAYARKHAVVSMRWDESACAVRGRVQGSHGEVYSTTAYFASGFGQALGFAEGECDCPVGLDCKHVVALVLTAAGRVAGAPRRTKVTWEQSLNALLTPAADAQGTTPLAIELSLAGEPRAYARVVRPGRSGWVAGGLSWTRLEGDFLPAHVRLLRELYGLSGSYDERFIDLSGFDSPRLWPMLAEADELGLRLIHSRVRLGDVARHDDAVLLLDATRKGANLVLDPALRIPSVPDPVPVTFIGDHGVVHVDRGELSREPREWRLALARLKDPAPPALRQLTAHGRRLEIPLKEQRKFAAEYYPRLRRLAPVVSSDDSFTPLAISAPKLALHADYGEGHRLALRWEWAYEVEGRAERSSLSGQVAPYRDERAERALLADLADVPLEQFGLRSNGTLWPSEIRGIDTMLFTTEVLPRLLDRPEVDISVDGESVDYREVGDSVTIGVSTSAIPGDNDWFDLGITIRAEGREVPFLDVFVALARDQSHLLLPDGGYFSLEKPELQALRRLIEEARALQDASDGTLKLSRYQATLWDELAALGVVEEQAEAWDRQVNGLLSVSTAATAEVPSTLTAQLRPYQVDGYRWLTFLWEHRLGGILADDMGLGKTLQSLALICHARAEHPFLIVAPTSVVSNWKAEAAKFAPTLNVATVTRRGTPLPVDADVVITSYTLLRLDAENYANQTWSALIMDEAQYTKNHQSKVYQSLRKVPAPVKLAITGTPMENNVMELWSLLSITAPGLFPSPTRFRDYYARPIERDNDTELLAQLRRRVRPLMKRRTKEQVAADLPPKLEQVLEVELAPRHRKLYQTVLQRERQKVLGLLDDMNGNRFTILRSLTSLRQLALHAGLVDEEHAAMPSAKIDALVEQLADVVAGGHRALVFSQFTSFLSMVQSRLAAEGIDYCYLDGKTRNRQNVISAFKDGRASAFLISLKAGGFGLNLTEADYCFLLDPWWNPATEAQAVDRTHRIGQTRNVMVYRLIAKDTIEEKVMALQSRKAELFRNVMDDGEIFSPTLTKEDIQALFE
ncbi:DEAD/DEAH box helicase [Actinophytocola oryzae]|uniref:SNF2 family DNA or RNA helicase n=1 Tax=Actinophytocola oryzae TaxID=502181 RepID=A0A4R7UVL0_9PSEU|nr:DEAD/DEAH box helicase [Actinophytocola oryzae]TDV40084.1 SNF2 family DNA or RNA helicase [Actinophytocola oryzae]